MPETMSLSELKAKNAELETEKPEVEVEETQEADQDETEVEQVESEAAEEESTDNSEEVDEEESEVEDWLKTDSDEDDSKSDGFKPDGLAAKIRRKYKEKAAKKDDEIEALRKEIESLKNGATKPAQGQNDDPMPTIEAHDYDSDSYNKAMADWQQRQIDKRLSSKDEETRNNQMAEAKKKAVELARKEHYQRAAELIESGMVSEEQYIESDNVLRDTIESTLSIDGDIVLDSMIQVLNGLGPGGEKVTYALGVNKAKRDKFLSLLQQDQSGALATAYLGELRATVQLPNKRKSNAPKPSSVETKPSGGGKAENLHQKWAKMKPGPERVSLKRKARAEGIDTSNWN